MLPKGGKVVKQGEIQRLLEKWYNFIDSMFPHSTTVTY